MENVLRRTTGKIVFAATLVLGLCFFTGAAHAEEIDGDINLSQYSVVETYNGADFPGVITATDVDGNVVPLEDVAVTVYKSNIQTLATDEMIEDYAIQFEATYDNNTNFNSSHSETDGGYRCTATGTIYYQVADNGLAKKMTSVSGTWTMLDSGFTLANREYGWKSCINTQSGSETTSSNSFNKSLNYNFYIGTLSMSMSCDIRRGIGSEPFAISFEV